MSRRICKSPCFDGVVCLADHYAPHHVGPRPTILMRSPYGERIRAGWIGRICAEQGFHVLMQSCRGTFGSEGTWDPFRGEREDGQATVAWLKQQACFNGELALFQLTIEAPEGKKEAWYTVGPDTIAAERSPLSLDVVRSEESIPYEYAYAQALFDEALTHDANQIPNWLEETARHSPPTHDLPDFGR